MKKLFLLALLVCGVSATSFAQLVESTTIVDERVYQRNKTEYPRYEGEVNVGYAIGGSLDFDYEGMSFDNDYKAGSPFFETIHGARINKYFFVGGGVGVRYMSDPEVAWLPIFANAKGYYPVSKDFAPYLSLSLGTAPGLNYDFWSFYCNFGLGFNYKKFNFGLGIMHQSWKESDVVYYGDSVKFKPTSFYLKVGLKF